MRSATSVSAGRSLGLPLTVALDRCRLGPAGLDDRGRFGVDLVKLAEQRRQLRGDIELRRRHAHRRDRATRRLAPALASSWARRRGEHEVLRDERQPRTAQACSSKAPYTGMSFCG
jgi:hypothetical protein